MKQDINDLNNKYNSIVDAKGLGLVYGSTFMGDSEGNKFPPSSLSISDQELENRNFLYNFNNLLSSHLSEVSELEEVFAEIKQLHVNEIKELQDQWGIKPEDRIL